MADSRWIQNISRRNRLLFRMRFYMFLRPRISRAWKFKWFIHSLLKTETFNFRDWNSSQRNFFKTWLHELSVLSHFSSHLEKISGKSQFAIVLFHVPDCRLIKCIHFINKKTIIKQSVSIIIVKQSYSYFKYRFFRNNNISSIFGFEVNRISSVTKCLSLNSRNFELYKMLQLLSENLFMGTNKQKHTCL